ncbi:hypothetical protein LLB_2847 [Legionella longbeachae D-4968]|nr:hypothetical protein LLB_2847 [Legionella longbeachae D-4968]
MPILNKSGSIHKVSFFYNEPTLSKANHGNGVSIIKFQALIS